jgi:hypothetical protein
LLRPVARLPLAWFLALGALPGRISYLASPRLVSRPRASGVCATQAADRRRRHASRLTFHISLLAISG